MEIVLNGERQIVEDATAVADLLARCGLPAQRVAVEVNEALVRRADFERTRLNDGDRVEIVTLVGGG